MTELPAADRKAENPWLKLALELGPLLVFFFANGRFGIFVATRGLHGGNGSGADRILADQSAARHHAAGHRCRRCRLRHPDAGAS